MMFNYMQYKCKLTFSIPWKYSINKSFVDFCLE